MPATRTDPGDDFSNSEFERCSYCGKQIYRDVMQCPHCKNYNDRKGPIAQAKQERIWRINRYEWLVLIFLFGFLFFAAVLAVLLYCFKKE